MRDYRRVFVILLVVVLGRAAAAQDLVVPKPDFGPYIEAHNRRMREQSARKAAREEKERQKVQAFKEWNASSSWSVFGDSEGAEIDVILGKPDIGHTIYDDGSGQHAVYFDAANQPAYEVAMGAATLRFQGAVVRLFNGGGRWLHAFSGWSTRVEHDPVYSADQVTARYTNLWLKGRLVREVSRTRVLPKGTCGAYPAVYTYHYVYYAPDGTVTAFYERPRETARTSTWTTNGVCSSSPNVPAEPRYYWSTEGNAALDASDECLPLVRWSNGETEEFHMARTDPNAFDTEDSALVAPPYRPACSATDLTRPLRRIDRNGNVTTYRFTATTETATDSQGRETVLTFDEAQGMRRLRTVDVPSIGAAPPQRYSIQWRSSPLEVRFDVIWPDVQCGGENGAVFPCSSSHGAAAPSLVPLVDSITVPDGRRYRFEYGPWGNLIRVTEPAGAVREYLYGDASNLEYARAVAPLYDRVSPGFWIDETLKIHARGQIGERLLPDGLDGPAYTTSYSFLLKKLSVAGCRFDTVGAAYAGPAACAQVWRRVVAPDGTVILSGSAVRSVPDGAQSPAPVIPHGWKIGEEIWSGANLLSATYYGDQDTGELWYENDRIELSGNDRYAVAANVRSFKSRTVREGLSTTINLEYGDSIDIDPDPVIAERRTTSVTQSCTYAGVVPGRGCALSGVTPLVKSAMTYRHYFDGTWRSRNLLNLGAATGIFGPNADSTAFSDVPLTEESLQYDQFAVTPSGRPAAVLDASPGAAAGSPRGNVTTNTRRVSAARSVSVQTHYFDTGAIGSVTDARGFTTSHVPDFALCTSAPTLTTTTTNPLGHVTSTTIDCMSGSTLETKGVNGESTYVQYDDLGRPVETAGPGDLLTALPQTGARPYTRLSTAPTGPGTEPGAARPGSWTEYALTGVVGQQRTVAHIRDGAPGGRYVKTFSDGLGRTIQTRSEEDPAETGFAESVTTTRYDRMGRIADARVPCFDAASDTVTPHCSAVATITEFDGLGRPTKTVAPGNRITTMNYGSADGRWVTTSVNPRGFVTKVHTNLLGQTVQVDRQSSRCPGGFCSTTMTYDAVGNVLTVSDGFGHTIRTTPDGLGRTVAMSDPDLGNWSYEYDDNGNMTAQTDAKGQRVTFTYDALNRITLKDLSPAGPSNEDVTYFYDGNGPEPPAEPAPTLSAITPATAGVGGPAFTLTASGANFAPEAVVTLNGQQRPTTVIDSRRATAAISAADLQTAGVYAVNIVNPAPGGGASAALTFTVTNPPPAANKIQPTSAARGGAAFTLTVSGSDFVSGAVVTFDGQKRQTTFVSAQQVTAAILASDLSTAGTHFIVVVNPAPGGGSSEPIAFSVTAPGPAISSLAPASTVRGSVPSSLTVNGSNFVSGAVVTFNGQNRQTTFVSAGQLTAALLASDVQSAGFYSVAVVNPGTGGSSGTATFTVTNPVPVITAIAPASAVKGGAAFNLDVNGNNFVPGAAVSLNGQARQTTFVSAQQLRAAIPATDLQTAGAYAISAVNPGPGGGASAAVTFTVTNPPPTVSLTAPAPGQLFASPATINITANASSAAGITKVEFFRDGVLLSADTTAPYDFVWANVDAGTYVLTAKAMDGAGMSAQSAAVSITVQNSAQLVNFARGKSATQSSEYPAPGAQASLAVDGFTQNITSTDYRAQQWWQVDLGTSRQITEIRIWNRSDCCQERLSNFYVFVSDYPFTADDPTVTAAQRGVFTDFVSGVAPQKLTRPVNRTGRFVRVQLSGTNWLSLAEVEVMGPTGLPAVPGSGFEAPALAANSSALKPAGTSWTFTGTAGVTTNKSAYTANNPDAPEGKQVAFLQGVSSVSQVVSGFASGVAAVVRVNAAQRSGSNDVGQELAVSVDGMIVGTFRPSSTSYSDYTSSVFLLSAGAHTLQIAGRTSTGDNTAFIDNVRLDTAEGAEARIVPAGVTASGSAAPPQRAMDGDLATAWNAGGYPAQFIQFDLGAAYSLKRIRLRVLQSPDGAATHVISGGSSPDPATHRSLGTIDGSFVNGQWLELATAANDIRYLRVSTTSSPSWVAWSEIEIYCDPAAQRIAVSSVAASQTYTGTSPQLAVDGNSKTAWNAGAFPVQSITLDLGRVVLLNKLRLQPIQDPSGATTHVISAGTVPDQFVDVGTIDMVTENAKWIELNGVAKAARYIKVTTTRGPSWVGWFEIEPYGQPVAGAQP
ncbi:MAG TPA: discoidin domain-containing protein [Thermoanaerobaculia bacterium]|jgi:YD repeat-containing protein